MIQEEGDVITSLPQWRQKDGHDVDPVVEIFPEPFVHHILEKIPVRGGDQSHVDRDGLYPANPFEFPLLDRPEQLCLHVPRQIADFIEKRGSRVGLFESPGFSVNGPVKALSRIRTVRFPSGFRGWRRSDLDKGFFSTRAVS